MKAGIIRLTFTGTDGGTWHVSAESISEVYPERPDAPDGPAVVVLKWSTDTDGSQCFVRVQEPSAIVVRLWSRALGVEPIGAAMRETE